MQFWNETRQKYYKMAESAYLRLNRSTFGTLEILKDAYLHYFRVGGSEGAATIAFFTLFAVPPLLIVVVTLGSFFLSTEEIHRLVLDFVQGNLPISSEVVLEFISNSLEQRATLGVIGVIGLLWSGSGVLSALTSSIDRAFPDIKRRNPILNRLIGLLMIGGLGMLLILTSLLTTIVNLIYNIRLPFGFIEPSPSAVPIVVLFLIRSVVLMGLYLWIPRTPVKRRAAFLGALLATSAIEVVNRAFSWYLQRGMAFYNFLYGSLGTLVALMFWIYLTAQIIVICAHFTGALNHHLRIKMQTVTSDAPPRSQ